MQEHTTVATHADAVRTELPTASVMRERASEVICDSYRADTVSDEDTAQLVRESVRTFFRGR